jgi:hypothetical protein
MKGPQTPVQLEHVADATATSGAEGSAAWEAQATEAVAAVEESLRPLLRKASEGIYDDLLFTVQDYLLDNILYNVKSQIAAADRQANSDRQRAATEGARGDRLEAALRETWRVLRAAGTLNLSNGVQLGQTSWYVKICDAEAMSDAALAGMDVR